MYEPYDKDTASPRDRIAWVLCQIIDDDAPLRWTRYRGVASCIARSEELMRDLTELRHQEERADNVLAERAKRQEGGDGE